MLFSDKIVTEIPLQMIWDSEKEVNIQRSSYLTKDRIQEMLKTGPIQFVLADVGRKLEWIDKSECYTFWKSKVQANLAEDVSKITLDAFPNNYGYIASEWTGDSKTTVILLEKYH